MQRDTAEIVALRVLAFLAEDRHRMNRFLAWTGLALAELQAGAGQAAVQGGILDYLLAHEALLVTFAEEAGLDPEAPAMARRTLSEVGTRALDDAL